MKLNRSYCHSNIAVKRFNMYNVCSVDLTVTLLMLYVYSDSTN